MPTPQPGVGLSSLDNVRPQVGFPQPTGIPRRRDLWEGTDAGCKNVANVIQGAEPHAPPPSSRSPGCPTWLQWPSNMADGLGRGPIRHLDPETPRQLHSGGNISSVQQPTWGRGRPHPVANQSQPASRGPPCTQAPRPAAGSATLIHHLERRFLVLTWSLLLPSDPAHSLSRSSLPTPDSGLIYAWTARSRARCTLSSG